MAQYIQLNFPELHFICLLSENDNVAVDGSSSYKDSSFVAFCVDNLM